MKSLLIIAMALLTSCASEPLTAEQRLQLKSKRLNTEISRESRAARITENANKTTSVSSGKCKKKGHDK